MFFAPKAFDLSKIQYELNDARVDGPYQKFIDKYPQCVKNDATLWTGHQRAECIEAMCLLTQEVFNDRDSAAFKSVTMISHLMQRMQLKWIDLDFIFEGTKDNIKQEMVSLNIESQDRNIFNKIFSNPVDSEIHVDELQASAAIKNSHFWEQHLYTELLFDSILSKVKSQNANATGDETIKLVSYMIYVMDWLSEKNATENKIEINGLTRDGVAENSAEGQKLMAKTCQIETKIRYERYDDTPTQFSKMKYN